MGWFRAWLPAHRGFRRLIGALITLFALSMVLGIVVISALHTDWGREQLRSRIEAALDDSLRGKVTIGRIDGSPLTRLTAHDFTIAAADGRPVIHAAEVDIDFDLLELASQTFSASEISLGGLEISARAQPGGGFDLTEALASTHPSTEPSKWLLDIQRLSVAGARVTIQTASGDVERIEDIDISASGKIGPEGRALRVKQASARWEREDLRIKIGELAVDGDHATGSDVVVQQDGATATIDQFSTSVTGDDAFAIFHVDAAPHAIAARTHMPWRAGVAVQGMVKRERSVWRGAVSGRVGGSPVMIVGTADSSVPAVTLWLSGQGVQPQQIIATAPVGKVDLHLQIQVTELALNAMTAQVHGTVSGVLAGNDLGTAQVDATLADRTVTAEIVARGGMLDGKVRARAGLDPDGPLSAHADIEAEKLVIGTARMTDVRATADLHGQLDRPSGKVEVAAGSIVQGSRRLGPGKLSLALDGDDGRATFQIGGKAQAFAARGDVRLARRGSQLSADIASLAVSSAGTTWSGSRGRIEYDRGQVQVRGLRVTSSIGSFDLSGRLDGERRGRIALDGQKIDLEAIDRMLGLSLPADLTGTATVSAAIDLPAGPGRIVAQFHDAGWADRVDRVAGTLTLELEHRQLTAGVTLRTSQRGGRAQFDIVAPGPADLTAIGPWLRRLPGSLQSVQAKVDRLSLDTVQELARRDLGLTGDASATVAIGPGMDGPARVTGTIARAGWRERDVRLSGTFDVQARSRRMTAEVNVKTSKGGSGKASLIAGAPASMIDAAGWARLGPPDVESLRASVDDLSLATIQSLTGKRIEATGKISGSIQLGRGLERGEVRLAVDRIETPRLPAPVSGLLRATIDPSSTDATAHIKLADQLLGRLQLSTRRGLRQIAADPALLRTTPIEAEMVVPGLPLDLLMRLTGGTTEVKGSVTARATFRGTIAQPHATWTLASHDLAVSDAAVGELTANGKLDLDRWSANLRAAQRAGGTLDVTAGGDTVTLTSAQVQARAHQFEIAFLEPALTPFDVRALAGVLDADVRMSGGTASGTVRVRDGRFRMLGPMRAIRKATVDATLAGKRANVKATGRYGRGDFDIDGQMWLEGLRPSVFRATAKVDDITIPAGSMPADISASLTIRGQMTDRLLAATIDVSRGEIELPDRKGNTLHPVSGPDYVVFVDEKKDRDEAPKHERAIRIRLNARKGIRVRGEPIDALFTTDLVASMVRGQLSVVGTVRATRGTLTLFDRRYDIRRATMTFDGEMPPNPDLDVQLEHDFDGSIVSIDVTGTANAPRVALSSNPPTYDDTQLIGLVVTGSPSSGTAEGAGSLEGAAAGAASALIGKQVSRVLQRTLPIDTVRLASAEGSESTFVLVGKWVSDKVFIAYRRSIMEQQDNENANQALIEYHISRQWMIEGHYGDAGEGGADVLWTVRL